MLPQPRRPCCAGASTLHTTCARNSTIRMQDFAAAWASLVTDVLTAAPEAQGRLLFDIMNEPDGRAPGHNFYMHSQHAINHQCYLGWAPGPSSQISCMPPWLMQAAQGGG